MSIQQLMLGVGAKKKTYMDDVFSTYLHTATGSTLNINNGIDLSGEGGLVWFKRRNSSASHQLYDTARGVTKQIYSDNSGAESSISSTLTTFNNNGFTLGTNGGINTSGDTYASWTLRKAPGFFDVVTYTGNGSNRTIAHSLKSVPGMILIKNLSSSENWRVYHRGIKATHTLILNTDSAAFDNDTQFNDTEPTSSVFSVSTDNAVNQNGDSFVAYLFAGGESTAATARSVDFDGNDKLTLAATSDFDFGTGDWTVEGWWKSTLNSNSSDAEALFALGSHSNAGGMLLYQYNGKLYLNKANSDVITIDSNPFDNQFKQWLHVAVVKSGNTVTVYVDGTALKSVTDSGSFGDGSNNNFYIGASSGGHEWEGCTSNLRVVKGTAVYT